MFSLITSTQPTHTHLKAVYFPDSFKVDAPFPLQKIHQFVAMSRSSWRSNLNLDFFLNQRYWSFESALKAFLSRQDMYVLSVTINYLMDFRDNMTYQTSNEKQNGAKDDYLRYVTSVLIVYRLNPTLLLAANITWKQRFTISTTTTSTLNVYLSPPPACVVFDGRVKESISITGTGAVVGGNSSPPKIIKFD